ncbi:ammonium transporter [Brachybacterium kimchii]|uniref:Ammonium transporter n=1 Tax=Brachybacterium kimchii TaxID=2942909 RepID=A0ABY4N9V1_9MICO|nr:ammonium transporter [Brachybacterium kimchii]UQN31338.1 ammonium transporter [Brachybacterium kimchii]
MEPFTLDTGATAWLLVSASLVLLMTPALAFFYGGMVRARTVLNMMLMSFAALGVGAIVWTLLGYSIAFGDDIGGLLGNPLQFFGLHGEDAQSLLAGSGVPFLVAAGFQMTFAIITLALISGAIADRVRFGTWIAFSAVWIILCYAPMAHMVWGGGLLSADGPFAAIAEPIDFAGGTVVHINAGTAGLVLALIVGKRLGWGRDPMKPHSLPLVMLGAALLWFGWFGFNAGSAGTADGTAGLAWVNTTVATAAAMLGWMITEKIRDRRVTSLGAASGVVAGLVAITPAAAAVSPIGAIVLGAVAGAVCALAVGLKYRLGFDDSLDVVGVHLVGGLVGTVLIGLLGTDTGLFYGGGIRQLLVQILIAIAAMVFSAVVTAIIALVLRGIMGWRITEDEELAGIDVTRHAETAWDLVGGPASRRSPHAAPGHVGPAAGTGSVPHDHGRPAPLEPAAVESAPVDPASAEPASADPSPVAAQPATTGEPR